ncbi:MAG: tyrosine-type recombinase/integrase [Blastocatellia bacterium]|nr:tyrosine-type recombinase/integrase [Blastocatellia bacterium]
MRRCGARESEIPHDTRHTFATRLRANGVHGRDIRDLLGHTSVRMTSVYTHQTPANLCHAVNTLGQTKLGKVVRFPRKKRDRSTRQIAPSSRHREVDQLSAQHHEDVSVRQLAS